MRCKIESAFATDDSGTLGNYFDVPFTEGTATLKTSRPLLPVGHAQQFMDGMAEAVLGPKSATLEFECNLETLTTKCTNTVTATSGWLSKILLASMGGEQLGTGTTIASTSTSTSLVTTLSTNNLVGGAVGCATGTGSALEIREIKSKSSNTLALKLALSGAPSNGSTVYGAATYFMSATDGSAVNPIQFLVEDANTESRWQCLGGGLQSMSMTLGPGVIPKLKFAFKFANYNQADGALTVADLTGGVLSLSSYSNNVTIVQKDSEFRSQVNGTTTLSSTLLPASTIEFKPNISYVPASTPAGTQTVLQWVRVHTPPVISGSFVIPFQDDMSWFTNRDSRTDQAFWYQIGSSTTDGGILISAPTAQVSDPYEVDTNGIHGLHVDWQGRHDGDTSGASNAILGRSAFRIHLV
jgi:hypothetical protein